MANLTLRRAVGLATPRLVNCAITTASTESVNRLGAKLSGRYLVAMSDYGQQPPYGQNPGNPYGQQQPGPYGQPPQQP